MPREGVFRFATPLPKRVYRPFIDYESQIEIDDKVCRVPTKDAWGWKGDVIVTAPFCWHWFGDFYFFGVFGKYTLFFLIGLFLAVVAFFIWYAAEKLLGPDADRFMIFDRENGVVYFDTGFFRRKR
ncbi:hypothetical protein CAI21_08525 [Alkalilimnicola ehrlichii]|uniref:hypothetical protein n=1 Tax=Alkalilimnicola ehrlichii TaxID=351052 RepID=UPI000E363E7C|nr:hypothetical protein [Alkalilimnicola ehrlichii]RFA29869.1 hypothetical protein CAI21_08525 [Alkalilimnicola ehrlichii]